MERNDRREAEAILLAGPTASGKSTVAMELAQRLHGVVVNTDALQVYASLRVTTARPSVEDEARVPHALYGHVDLFEQMSTARYLGHVQELLISLKAAGKIPIFTGGTGLYFQALEEGLAPVPPIEPEVRETVRRMDAAALHAALMQEDTRSAKALRRSDTQRMARSLEVVRSTGRSLLDWQSRTAPGPLAGRKLRRILLIPDRQTLHDRIEKRAERIVRSEEALREVGDLVAQDPAGNSLPSKAIGVAQINALAQGEADAVEATRRLTVTTRRYAKRQCTWFNNSLRGGWERHGNADAVLLA